MKLHNPATVDPATAGILRRLAAGCYDWLLAIAIMMMISLLFVASRDDAIPAGNRAYQALLLAIAVSFFVGFWAYRGQTPGMRAWHLRLESRAGGKVSLGRALGRFGGAVISFLPLGMGFWWQRFDRDKLAWHDRWSGTRLIRTKK